MATVKLSRGQWQGNDSANESAPNWWDASAKLTEPSHYTTEPDRKIKNTIADLWPAARPFATEVYTDDVMRMVMYTGLAKVTHKLTRNTTRPQDPDGGRHKAGRKIML